MAVGLRPALKISLWRALTKMPFAILLLLLFNPQTPQNPATTILALRAVILFIAQRQREIAFGEKSGREGVLN